MAVDPKKRQRKLQKHAAKRKSKHRLLVRANSAGLPERIRQAAQYPILHCLASQVLLDQGLGSVFLSRALPNGSVAFANFLVDRYCLGVKNVHADVVGKFTYESKILHTMRQQMEGREITPATARKWVESAVDYARNLGFHPHLEYEGAKGIFGSIDPSECQEELEFGKDGKPLFINGPRDSMARCRQITNILERSCGKDGYRFVYLGGSLPGSLEMLPFEDSEHRPLKMIGQIDDEEWETDDELEDEDEE